MLINLDPIDVDLESPQERALLEFLEQSRCCHTLTKDLLLLGHAFFTSSLLPLAQKQAAGAKATEASTGDKDAVIAALKDAQKRDAEAAERQHALAIEAALLKQRLDYEQRLHNMKCDLATLTRATSVVDELRAALQEPHRVEVERLKDEVASLQGQLATLKRTNAGKGALGEFAIASWLKRTFPAFDVLDILRDAACCDIHVRPHCPSTRQPSPTCPDTFFAVESKFKEQVTARDIDKFYRDVTALTEARGEAFLGAIMVSLRSRNIPGKGPFAFELTPSLRPLVFIGFDSPDDLTLLQYCVPLVLEVAAQCRSMSSLYDAAEELRVVQGKLQPLVSRVAALRKDIDAIKDAAGRIVKSCDGVYSSLSLVFDEIARVAGTRPSHRPGHRPGQSVACPSCGNAFSPNGIKQHVAACRRKSECVQRASIQSSANTTEEKLL